MERRGLSIGTRGLPQGAHEEAIVADLGSRVVVVGPELGEAGHGDIEGGEYCPRLGEEEPGVLGGVGGVMCLRRGG